MSDITWDVRIDWDNDGAFTGTGENVTSRVLTEGTGPITIGYGRDTSRAMSPIAAGSCDLAINNSSKDYSPENGASPLAGNVLPSRPVRVQATHDSVLYTVFQGFTSLDGYDVDPIDQVVRIGCLDAIAKLAGRKISTELHEGLQTGEAIGHVLDAIGWPPGDRDIDTGATTMRYWWEDDTNAFTALQRIVASEGSPALVTVDADGNFVFRDRHHRITRSASTTSQATFRDATTDPIFSGFSYDHGWRDIVNTVDFRIDERHPTGQNVEVWSTDDLFDVPASSSTVLHARASDPFVDAVAPVEDTDFIVQSGSVTNVTLSRTSGQSTIITLTGGVSGAVVNGLKLRARSVEVVRSYRITASDSSSQDDYGELSMPSEMEPVWAGRHDAQGIADLLILQRADRLPIITIMLDGLDNDTVMAQQLARDLSDRITVVETQTTLNEDFFIERIEHTISESGDRVITVFKCEKAPASPTSGFILGTSELGTGVLGY